MEWMVKFQCYWEGSGSISSIALERVSPDVLLLSHGMEGAKISHAQNPNLIRSCFVTFFLDEYFRSNTYFLFCYLVWSNVAQGEVLSLLGGARTAVSCV